MEKQAAEAVSMLVAGGVDANDAAQLVMEKMAGTALDIFLHGHAGAERRLAAKHDKTGPEKGFMKDLEHNFVPHAGLVGSAMGGGVLGAGLGLSAGGIRGIIPGYVLGSATGMAATAKFQAQRMEDRYAEKQAAVNMLVEEGVDFDSAVSMVSSKSSELYGD